MVGLGKIQLLGLGNEGKRSYFVFEKKLSFFPLFSSFLESIGTERPASFYQYDERSINLCDVTDSVEHTNNGVYDIDIFYGENRIVVVIRTSIDRAIFLPKIKKIAKYGGF